VSTTGRCFFILTAPRSGSTSLARILATATNGHCAVEPPPNLHRESRLMMEGRLTDPEAVLEQTVVERVRAGMREHGVYGEKDLTFGPFVTQLRAMLDCRFIHLTRDGRDVVRSLIDWHCRMFGSIYRECSDRSPLSVRARKAAAAVLAHEDASDFARPRPGPDDPLADRWEDLGRAEVYAYYWSALNDLYADACARLPRTVWRRLDYTDCSADDLFEVAAFVGLEGLDRTRCTDMLAARINSTAERGVEAHESPAPYADWRNWDGGSRRRFAQIAGPTMERLGYWSEPAGRWRPTGFGSAWRARAGDVAWHEQRRARTTVATAQLGAWLAARRQEGARVERVAELGCGLVGGIEPVFLQIPYLGVDAEPANVAWCQRYLGNPGHRYLCHDFAAQPLPEPVDLVFSHQALDSACDVEAQLASIVRSSRQWIYLVAFGGGADLTEHSYQWDDATGCYSTRLSAGRVREALEAVGCRDIVIESIRTGEKGATGGLRIVARVPGAAEASDAC
jgi:hypothetical protein